MQINIICERLDKEYVKLALLSQHPFTHRFLWNLLGGGMLAASHCEDSLFGSIQVAFLLYDADFAIISSNLRICCRSKSTFSGASSDPRTIFFSYSPNMSSPASMPLFDERISSSQRLCIMVDWPLFPTCISSVGPHMSL